MSSPTFSIFIQSFYDACQDVLFFFNMVSTGVKMWCIEITDNHAQIAKKPSEHGGRYLRSSRWLLLRTKYSQKIILRMVYYIYEGVEKRLFPCIQFLDKIL